MDMDNSLGMDLGVGGGVGWTEDSTGGKVATTVIEYTRIKKRDVHFIICTFWQKQKQKHPNPANIYWASQ